MHLEASLQARPGSDINPSTYLNWKCFRSLSSLSSALLCHVEFNLYLSGMVTVPANYKLKWKWMTEINVYFHNTQLNTRTNCTRHDCYSCWVEFLFFPLVNYSWFRSFHVIKCTVPQSFELLKFCTWVKAEVDSQRWTCGCGSGVHSHRTSDVGS